MEGVITYAQASDLKALGYNEPSLGYYTETTQRLSCYGGSSNPSADFKLCTLKDIYHTYCLAPFSHDVFKWFRKKGYGIEVYSKSSENKEWYFLIKKGTITTSDIIYSSQEEAETECVNKLVEIEKRRQPPIQ